MAGALSMLFRRHIKPHARRSNARGWRRVMAHPDVNAVIEKCVRSAREHSFHRTLLTLCRSAAGSRAACKGCTRRTPQQKMARG